MPDMDVSVYLEQPGEEFSYLSGYSDIKNTLEEDKKFDVFIVLDCSSIDRIEPFARGFENADKTICIDHHISKTALQMLTRLFLMPVQHVKCCMIH